MLTEGEMLAFRVSHNEKGYAMFDASFVCFCGLLISLPPPPPPPPPSKSPQMISCASS